MVGSIGQRMLEITLPYVEMWNAWFADYGNDLERLRQLLARIDATCEQVGRDPATLEKTICPLVTFERGELPVNPNRVAEREIRGDDPALLAAELNAYAASGISHVQLVLDPITPQSIEQAARALEHLRA